MRPLKPVFYCACASQPRALISDMLWMCCDVLKKIVVRRFLHNEEKNLLLIVAVCIVLSSCASRRPTHSNDERIERLNQSLGGKNVTYIIKLTSSGRLFIDAIGAVADHLNPLPNTETLTRFLRACSTSPT